MNKLLPIFLFLISITAHANKISLSAISNNNNCRINHKCDFKGSHDIEIINNTNAQQTYKYEYSLCIQYVEGRYHCPYVVKSEIAIPPNQRWNNHYDGFGKFTFTNPDRLSYPLIASTKIYGYDNELYKKQYVVSIKR